MEKHKINIIDISTGDIIHPTTSSDLVSHGNTTVDIAIRSKSPLVHDHDERYPIIADLEDVSSEVREVSSRVTSGKWSGDTVQTVSNAIGWEKNILFQAHERFTIKEPNSKAAHLGTMFDGGLAPTNCPNISASKPYIIEITGLPPVNTQGKGTIGWVSRFRIPVDFKIEWYNNRASKWEVLSDIKGHSDAFYYSSNFTGEATGVRLTITRVNNMVDAYAQIAQIVFINPEVARMYDYLLAKHSDLSKLEARLDAELAHNQILEQGDTSKRVPGKIYLVKTQEIEKSERGDNK